MLTNPRKFWNFFVLKSSNSSSCPIFLSFKSSRYRVYLDDIFDISSFVRLLRCPFFDTFKFHVTCNPDTGIAVIANDTVDNGHDVVSHVFSHAVRGSIVVSDIVLLMAGGFAGKPSDAECFSVASDRDDIVGVILM